MKAINKGNVTEVKCLAKPPQEVKNVVTATAILMGMSPEEAKVRSLLLLLLSIYGGD